MGHSPTLGEFLGTDAPTNWGKWGPEDKVGCRFRDPHGMDGLFSSGARSMPGDEVQYIRRA